jgi:cathepsin K
MKNKFYHILTLLLFFNYSCEYYIEQPEPDTTTIIVPDIITIDPSPDDPQETGINCDSHLRTNTSLFSNIIENLQVSDNLTPKIDLSKNMPPVRSQGSQGSCVAWALGYYLKSYQEKVQHGYEYETFEDVMSPSFIYNQVKVAEDCSSGSNILTSLLLLQETGVSSWKDFPYSEIECDRIPDDELIEKAKSNKIGEFDEIPLNLEHQNPNHTLINVMKTLLQEENPIIMSLDIKNINFKITEENLNQERFHIATNYNFTKESCGHAVLIIGYDDEIEAFKFVNSWGSDWKNDGYAWIHYSFFLQSSNPDYEQGVNSLYIAYDEEIPETVSTEN